uniref:AXH domain-containing protein n=1 Tax=Elaeophora elaphi TaxID=1147741 RepID=A0A0R3S5E3_9BILA
MGEEKKREREKTRRGKRSKDKVKKEHKIFEVYTLQRHMHNHDVDQTPLQINHDDHTLGKLLSLRTDDIISERDSVINIRKGERLTINSDKL